MIDPKSIVATYQKLADFSGAFKKSLVIEVETSVTIDGEYDEAGDSWMFTFDGFSKSQAHDIWEKAQAGKDKPEDIFNKKTIDLIKKNLPGRGAEQAWKNAVFAMDAKPTEVKFEGVVDLSK